MKRLALALVLLTGYVKAQKVFVFQNECCVELYKVHDELGEFLVYRVMDLEQPLDSTDRKIFKNWQILSEQAQHYTVDAWRIQGKRIECIRPPYRFFYVKKQPFITEVE